MRMGKRTGTRKRKRKRKWVWKGMRKVEGEGNRDWKGGKERERDSKESGDQDRRGKG